MACYVYCNEKIGKKFQVINLVVGWRYSRDLYIREILQRRPKAEVPEPITSLIKTLFHCFEMPLDNFESLNKNSKEQVVYFDTPLELEMGKTCVQSFVCIARQSCRNALLKRTKENYGSKRRETYKI